MEGPGIYIKEDASLSLSVKTSATAVPVFIGHFKKKARLDKSADSTDSGTCIALASWLDFVAQFEGPVTATVTAELEEENVAWKVKKTKEWANKLADDITNAEKVGNDTLIDRVKNILRSERAPGKSWASKKTEDLNEAIQKPNDLRAGWLQAIKTGLNNEDKNFKADNVDAWVNKWIDKTLQDIWQEFNDTNKDNSGLKAAVKALTEQKVASDDALTTVNKKHSFSLGEQVYSIPEKALSAKVTLNYGALALQHYFNNGGANCYVLPIAGGDLSKLYQEIQKYPDISLLIYTENDPHDPQKNLNVSKADVYRELNRLLEKNQGYFLLADSKDGERESDLATTEMHTAVYSPYLVTTFTPSITAAEDISFVDATGKSINLPLNWIEDSAFEKLGESVVDEIGAELEKISEIILPPSAAIAGIYARNDRERGVWKAPANVSLNAVKRVEKFFTDAEQGQMNNKGINVIRTFTGKGTMVWGARTLAVDSDNWRYIPVRRLISAAERDIKQAMRFAVFEPNNSPTWAKVKSAVENYLYSLWRQGALMGNSQQEAYFVHIGKDITMSEDDIKNGKMIVKVGVAAVRPVEFIILEFTQDVV